MPDIHLPFSMTADISLGAAPLAAPEDDPLPPGWVRIPVSFQITLPAGTLDAPPARQDATRATDG